MASVPCVERWDNASPRSAIPRSGKYRLVTRLERVNNRLTRWALRRGLAPRAFALRGDVFWLVAAHGDQADYVRNIKKHPGVRVRVAGTWRTGSTSIRRPDQQGAGQARTRRPVCSKAARSDRIRGTDEDSGSGSASGAKKPASVVSSVCRTRAPLHASTRNPVTCSW
jgi:hypothetical protein